MYISLNSRNWSFKDLQQNGGYEAKKGHGGGLKKLRAKLKLWSTAIKRCFYGWRYVPHVLSFCTEYSH
jgi:hypothetical protein